ncbi:hypothetical protein ABZ468_32360 [Streptomyces sp. NPDC005708]|uniref:hypothetical protein n=1 Tax=Streptomyces sp. NPDC005708 TaxID=3154564 RepID=UPI0033E86117
MSPSADGPEVTLAGGLLRLGEPPLVPMRVELARHLPPARPAPATGNPVDTAVRIALAPPDTTLELVRDEHPLRFATEKAD